MYINGNPKINFNVLPKRQFDVSYNVLENAKIKKAINWEPSFFLDTYLKSL
jgi:UDP-glucose 4-epimerase